MTPLKENLALIEARLFFAHWEKREYSAHWYRMSFNLIIKTTIDQFIYNGKDRE